LFSQKDFFDFLKKRKGLLEGIVIRGGEPTIHQELPEFKRLIKDFLTSIQKETSSYFKICEVRK